MHVEFDIEGIDPQPELFAFSERVLRNAAHRVSIDLSTVGRVVIVSPERFGTAVESIKPGATHTNTETLVAGGKTFPRRKCERVVSDIVLQCSLLETLADVLGDPPASTHWRIDQQQAMYVISHEFGHALDHTLRNDASEVADPRSRSFSIRETAYYYGSIVLTEYAACRNSASVMTDPLFDHEMQEAGNRMKACAEQVRQFLDKPEELTPRALAHFTCQGAWLNMVELSKLYGHATRNVDLEIVVRQLEMELIEGTLLGDTLERIGSIYPNWDIPDLVADLTTIWHRYAALCSVRFVTNESGTDEMEDFP